MKINDIKLGMSDIAITAKVIDVGETRDVMTRYGKRRVANATLEDDSGEISISLWQDQIESIKPGDVVNITGAFVTDFRDKLQLNIPRSGKIEVAEQ